MKDIIENIDIINALASQISALLDLVMSSDENVDHRSVTCAAEMSVSMLDQLMSEMEKIERKWEERYSDDNDLRK